MTQPPANWAWLARVRKPQGRKGEVFADILTDFPEKFAERKQLWLIADPDAPRPNALGTMLKPAPAKGTGFSPSMQSYKNPGTSAPALPREVELLAHWPHKGGIVLHFAGSASISDAEALAGLIVAIPAQQRAPLSDDEVYIADLIGCTLVDVAGPAPVEVGVIEEVDRSAGPVALLVIGQPGSPEEILVPFAKSFLRRIDIASKRLEMALPVGLIELNSTRDPQP